MDNATSTWPIANLHPQFGAKLEGHTIGPLLHQELRNDVIQAVHRFGLVVLPKQNLSDDDLYDFAISVGKVCGTQNILATDRPRVFRLTNLDDHGNILPANDKSVRFHDGNSLWHTDSTYLRPRATISMLHARVIPPFGGETEFCDTRCAFDELTSNQKVALGNLVACHSLIHSRALMGFSDWAPEERRGLPPIERPLVHLHKESGRKALCLAAHIADIKPLARDEAQRLLSSLMNAATKSSSVYSHKWSVGDFLLWDNRCTMHRARPYDQLQYGRDLRSIRLDDEEELRSMSGEDCVANSVY